MLAWSRSRAKIVFTHLLNFQTCALSQELLLFQFSCNENVHINYFFWIILKNEYIIFILVCSIEPCVCIKLILFHRQAKVVKAVTEKTNLNNLNKFHLSYRLIAEHFFINRKMSNIIKLIPFWRRALNFGTSWYLFWLWNFSTWAHSMTTTSNW